MTVRKRGSAAALGEFLSARLRRPFDWKTWNCCTHLAEWVDESEGRNPMAGLPVVKNERQAARLVARVGGDMVGVWTALLRRDPLQSPALAAVGDPVVMRVGEHLVAGVCVGVRAACVAVGGGLTEVPMSEAVAAWRLEPLR
jgi:hypothetical protein